MTYIKQLTIDTDWLNAIDGMTVAAAIEYLSTLNPEHTLSYGLEGDTHGCDVTACLTYDVPMTNEEILASIDARYKRNILHYEDAKRWYIERNQMDRVPNCDNKIAELQAKWGEARARYE